MAQYRNRLGDRRHWRDLEVEVIKQRCAQDTGNVLNHKPDGFRLYGAKRRQLPTGQRFVYGDPEAQVGFIVKRCPEEDVVVTTLSRVGVSRRRHVATSTPR